MHLRPRPHDELMHMKNFLETLSLGRTPDSRLNLSAAVGTTIVRQVLASLLYFVAIWIITRQLGPRQNGMLATLLLLPQTLYAFLNLGLGASHVFHLSSGAGNHRSMRSANWILALLLWLAVVLLLAASSDALIAKYLPAISKPEALYASLLFPMLLLGAWTSALIQGSRDYQSYNRIVLIQPVVFCTAIVLLRSAGAISVLSVLSCHILSQCSLWLLSETRVRRLLAPGAAQAYRFADAVSYGLRAHLSNIITFMNYRLALYLVSYMLGAAPAGLYALSIQLAEVLWLIASAASMIVFPESAAHSKSPAELHRMILKIAAKVFQVTCAGALVAAALAPVALPWIFGQDFAGSVQPLIILLPGIAVWSYMSVLSNSLAGMGQQKVNIHSALLCLTINIAGDLLLIPRFGANGAAFASTIAFSATALYTAVMYRKIMTEKLRNALP